MTELSPIRVAGRRPATSCRRSSAAGRGRGCGRCRGATSPSSTRRSWAASRRSSATIARLAGGGSPTRSSSAPAASHFLVADQAREAGARIEVVLEPTARDTLAAVAAAACVAERRDPGATLLVLPSDHLIPDAAAFAAAAERAAALAADGSIVVFGVQPTGPSTAYGYIERGAAHGEAHAVTRFVEKPDAGRAAELIGRGCLWNAGMFCFRVDAGLREIERLAPSALAAVRAALAEATDDMGAAARAGLRRGAEDQLRPFGDGAYGSGRWCSRRASSGRTSATGRRYGSRARATRPAWRARAMYSPGTCATAICAPMAGCCCVLGARR